MVSGTGTPSTPVSGIVSDSDTIESCISESDILEFCILEFCVSDSDASEVCITDSDTLEFDTSDFVFLDFNTVDSGISDSRTSDSVSGSRRFRGAAKTAWPGRRDRQSRAVMNCLALFFMPIIISREGAIFQRLFGAILLYYVNKNLGRDRHGK